ncbi:MAG: hypothetical protein E6G10_25625 [Actinobacteria bacterium]|nr:MAG: hypothetical protein E6G10_25625 [Actinomycetota bacterium]
MLFDTRARGRRRTIQIIYLGLAILMGGGLILFGIGGATSGGLLDAFKSNGGGGGGTNALEKNVQRAEKRVHAQPRNAVAWAELARAQYQVAGLGDNYDQNTGSFTAKGRRALVKVEHAWDRYLALDPPKPNPDLASLMVQAFSPTGLSRPEKAVAAQEIVVDARPPSTGLYSTLAILAYQAGQTRKGDLAAGKAVELAPKDQRSTLRDQLKSAKQQAVQPTTTSG